MEIDYMERALQEAEIAYKEGNFPVGSILLINKKIVDSSHNSITKENNYFSHSEMKLIMANSSKIKAANKKNDLIDIYTTLEPCLMCYGTMILHRVNSIYFSCPDPQGGFSLNKIELRGWYQNKKPKIYKNVLIEKTHPLMIKYLRNQTGIYWENMLDLFLKIR